MWRLFCLSVYDLTWRSPQFEDAIDFWEIVGIPWHFIDKMIGHLVEAINWNQLNNGNNLSALTQCSAPQILFNVFIFFFLPLKILPKMGIL